jgi:putative transposase
MSTKQGSLSLQASVRLRGGVLILKGYGNEEIADILDVSVSSVGKWRRKLRENGDDLTCLVRRKGSGRPGTLTDEQKQQLKGIIMKGALAAGYPTERWTSKIIADVIQKTFDVSLAPRSVRQILPTLGHRTFRHRSFLNESIHSGSSSNTFPPTRLNGIP